MKFPSFIAGLSVLGIAASTMLAVPPDWPSNYPHWWYDYGVINSAGGAYLNPNNKGPVNLGQLKWITAKASDYFHAALPTIGPGWEIDQMVPTFTSGAGNLAPINQGQLKNIAQYFYRQLIWIGYESDYPWTEGVTVDDAHYAPVLVGQLKKVFSFDLSGFTLDTADSDGDGLPNWWENLYGATSNSDDDYFSGMVEYFGKSRGFSSDAEATSWMENSNLENQLTANPSDELIIITPENDFYKVDTASLSLTHLP